MQKYEVLDHPAELRIRVFGETLEELFSNAVFAMREILKSDPNYPNKHPNEPNIKREIIKIESTDANSLLVDFLSEILTLSQINKNIYLIDKIILKCHLERSEGSRRDSSPSAQNDEESGGYFLQAELIGYPVDKFDEDIKAVTYEDLDIKKIDGVWQTMIVFDI